MIGIYIITNTVNNKVYIGQVGKGKNTTFMTRFDRHIRYLNGNYHRNKHLQSAWNKYGEDSFTFDILEECTQDKLDEREKYWIDYYDSYKNGYNRTLGGEGSLGRPLSEEAKQRISKANKGRMSGENHPLYGRHHSEETKRKISKANKNREETRQKISKNHVDVSGKNNPRYILRPPEMYEDIKNNMKCKEFIKKYNVSQKIYYSIKNELKDLIYGGMKAC